MQRKDFKVRGYAKSSRTDTDEQSKQRSAEKGECFKVVERFLQQRKGKHPGINC